MIEIKPDEYNGTYMHYGVREHGMAAAMNGIALHGGLIPYGGTFLCFSDYCRAAIRLAALMQIRTIFVMTHDSIGLGEDGPTHQPVEQLASLRAVPQLAVYCPGDPVETAECWELILDAPRQAALIALSRQPMPLLRREPGDENKSARGGYVFQEAEGGERKLTILSTGSELHLAVEAREILQKQGIPTAVVSMPCRLLFEQQDAAYKKAVLGTSRARVAVEAAVELGWERYIGLEGRFIGMHSFGASGKIADVYKKFDINAEAVVRAAHETLAEVAAPSDEVRRVILFSVASRTEAIKPSELSRVIVDTTVQPKNVTFPTDAKLLNRAREKLVRLAKLNGVDLRQSYARVGKFALIQHQRYAHAKQFKRAKRMLNKLRTYLGRVIRDIGRKIENNDALEVKFAKLLSLAHRVREQQPRQRGPKV
jgi:transketolase C-terminal domain/subunit